MVTSIWIKKLDYLLGDGVKDFLALIPVHLLSVGDYTLCTVKEFLLSCFFNPYNNVSQYDAA